MKISGTRLKISFHASCFCIKHRRRYNCMTSFQRGTKIRDHRIYYVLLGAVSIHFEHYWLRYKNFLGKSLSKFDYKKFLQHNYWARLFSRSSFRINVRFMVQFQNKIDRTIPMFNGHTNIYGYDKKFLFPKRRVFFQSKIKYHSCNPPCKVS